MIDFAARSGQLFATNALRTVRWDLKGANWFGAEGSSGCPDGLWQRPAAAYLDDLVRMRFNAVRLPLAVDNVLTDPLVPKWSLTENEAWRGKTSLQVLDEIVTLAARRNLLVLLDMHRLEAAVWPTAHGLWHDGETAAPLPIEQAWVKLARRYCGRWNVVAADLFNEPWGASWGGGDEATDWLLFSKRLGDIVLHECQRLLIVVEGVGIGEREPEGSQRTSTFCDLCFWGENLLGLDARPVAAPTEPAAAARDFGSWLYSALIALLQLVGIEPPLPEPSPQVLLPPSNASAITSRGMPRLRHPERLVMSPHVYGPGTNGAMWYFNRTAFPSYPDNLPAVWSTHWLAPARAAGATLVVGEWGGPYTDQWAADDELWQDRFKAFLLEERLSSFYWALNPNSGDTGGLLRDDWSTVHEPKRELLSALPSSDVASALASTLPFACVAGDAPPSGLGEAESPVFRCGEVSGIATCLHAEQVCNGVPRKPLPTAYLLTCTCGRCAMECPENPCPLPIYLLAHVVGVQWSGRVRGRGRRGGDDMPRAGEDSAVPHRRRP
jgi:aryl-phospho-beta-D-glucosidase BglC (GH1 family)